MGVSVYPIVEDPTVEWAGFQSAGKPLAKAVSQLDLIAKKNRVQGLMEFFEETREQYISEVLGGDPEDPSTYDESKTPKEKWFDPQEGLKTIRFFAKIMEENPGSVRDADPERIVKDIQEFDRILSHAASIGMRWHLGMSF
ncbi:MAG: hypothetical protein ABSH14_07600 [Verrucomicrobiia bacterium]|jgi:hypothetical protein